MRKIRGKIRKSNLKAAGLALAAVIGAGASFGVAGINVMAADDIISGEAMVDIKETEKLIDASGAVLTVTEKSADPDAEYSETESTEPVLAETEDPADPDDGSSSEDFAKPALKLNQTEGGTIRLENDEPVIGLLGDAGFSVVAEPEEGWYLKNWVFQNCTSYDPSNSEDIAVLVDSRSDNSEVSAVFAKLQEGEHLVYDYNEGITKAYKEGDPVTIKVIEYLAIHADIEHGYEVLNGELLPEGYGYLDEVTFIMPGYDISISQDRVEASSGGTDRGESAVKASVDFAEGGDVKNAPDGTEENKDLSGDPDAGKTDGVEGSESDTGKEKELPVNETDEGKSGESEAGVTDTGKTEGSEGDMAETAKPGKTSVNAANTTAVNRVSPVQTNTPTVRMAGSTPSVRQGTVSAPATGDRNDTQLWIGMAAGAVAAVIGVIAKRFRKEEG